MDSSFERAVASLPLKTPVAPAVVKTFGLLQHKIQTDRGWEGTCYLSTVVAHVLLREQGIETTLCIGDVACAEGVFDHGWSEIDNAICDLAIARPRAEAPRAVSPPIIAGLCLTDGKAPTVIHGAAPKSYGFTALDLSGGRAFIQAASVTEYIDGADRHGAKLWGVILDFAKRLELKVDRKMLQQKHLTTRWTLRDSVPVPPEVSRCW